MKKIFCAILFLSISFACEGVLFEEDLSDRGIQALAPLNNTVLNNTAVTFSWSEVEDADNYRLQIATPAFSNANQIVLDSLVPSTNFTQNLTAGDYEWRIKALNNSSATPYTTVSFSIQAEIFEDDISTETVTLIAPSEGAIITSDSVTFSWEEVIFAEEFTIQVATPNFENPIQVIVDETLTENSLSQMLTDGSYEWRVKAKNSSSETVYSSANFEVDSEISFEDQTVVIISPPDDFISNEPEINLQWQLVEGATLYRIQLIDPIDNSVVLEQTTIDTNIILTFPEGETTWQVRAENASANTSYSNQMLLVDSVSPNVPVLQTPMDLEEVPSATVTFTWTRDPIEGTAETDFIYIYSDVELTNLILNEEVSDNTFTTTLENSQTYYWLMNANDGAGNQSADSSVFSFNTQ